MILVFSSTLDNLELGLLDNNWKIINQESHFLKQQHSELMVSKIKDFIWKEKLKLRDLSAIYFTNGPGGFTGNRLGIVFAKTIKVLSDIPIYTIDTLSSLITNQSGHLSIDAKSHKFYTAKFNKGIIQKPILITTNNQSTIKIDKNVIKNMVDKKDFAQKITNLNDIKPLYVKEI